MEEHVKFFDYLAERKTAEVDLSDVTYALMQADRNFKKIFLDYCFGEGVVSCDCDVKREYQENCSRPDFIFVTGKEIYVLEVKKNDYNQHFFQYTNQFRDSRGFSFIANYKVDEDFLCEDDKKVFKGWICKTWEDFLALLTKESNSSALVVGYAEFLKKSIKYRELKKMNLLNVSSLDSFLVHIEKIFKDNKFNVYKPAKDNFSRLWYGLYGERIYSKNCSIYPFFGVFLGTSENKPCVCVGFRNDELWTPIKVLNKIKGIKEGHWFASAECNNEGNKYFFSMKDEYFEQLCNNSLSESEQHKILSSFFSEVCDIMK